jgi:hypothetical protein
VLGIDDALATKARHQQQHNSAHGAFKTNPTNAALGGIGVSLTGVALVLLLVFAPFGLMRLSFGLLQMLAPTVLTLYAAVALVRNTYGDHATRTLPSGPIALSGMSRSPDPRRDRNCAKILNLEMGVDQIEQRCQPRNRRATRLCRVPGPWRVDCPAFLQQRRKMIATHCSVEIWCIPCNSVPMQRVGTIRSLRNRWTSPAMRRIQICYVAHWGSGCVCDSLRQHLLKMLTA